MKYNRDAIIQKVLVGKATVEERDWLLSELLKLYNGLKVLLNKRRGGQCE